VWDLSPQVTERCLLTLEGHNDRVFCVDVFCNDTRAISGSENETLKVWDLSPQATVRCLYTGHV
jgi:WD40 repeat protein